MNLPSYGIILGVGYLFTAFIFWRSLKREGFDQERGMDLFIIGSLAALVFGRLSFVLENWAVFAADWGKIFLLVRHPGFGAVGAVSGGILATILMAKLLRLSWLIMLDLLSYSSFLFIAFLSAGCSQNLCLGGTAGDWKLRAGTFLVIWILANFTQRQKNSNFIFSRLLNPPGFYFFTLVIVIGLFNLPLAKNYHWGLYYFWVIATATGFGFWVGRYKNFMKMTIKFPAEVLGQVRSYLEDRRRQTEERLVKLKKEDPFDDKDRLVDNAADDTEAHEKAGHERTLALTAQLNAILVQIRKALTKIKIGKYGICESCGKMIDTDRLVALPTATLCVNCERKKEKK